MFLDGIIFGIIVLIMELFCVICDCLWLIVDGLWLYCLYVILGINLRELLCVGVIYDDLVEIVIIGWW